MSSLQAVLISVGSILASSGFWAYLQSRDGAKNATTRLLMGLAYDRVTTIGMRYIERGWITRDELEEFERYFYGPYKALGGNGVAERIWNDVNGLPFRSHDTYGRIFRNRNERYIPNVPVLSRPDRQARVE